MCGECRLAQRNTNNPSRAKTIPPTRARAKRVLKPRRSDVDPVKVVDDAKDEEQTDQYVGHNLSCTPFAFLERHCTVPCCVRRKVAACRAWVVQWLTAVTTKPRLFPIRLAACVTKATVCHKGCSSEAQRLPRLLIVSFPSARLIEKCDYLGKSYSLVSFLSRIYEKRDVWL